MNHEPIYVTKSFLPEKEEYLKYIDRIWDGVCLTNQGPLVQELTAKLKAYLGAPNFEFVSNGTVALMLALHVMGISSGEVITTPFTYVATTSAILWQGCIPVFADIDPRTMCMDPAVLEKKITKNTRAIMPVHVFGMPCDVDGIEAVARKYGLPVIYDAAHVFGVRYKGKSLVNYGDISTISFHATKLYHTTEGGAVIIQNPELDKKLQLEMRFGHNGDEHFTLGINGKNSEFHAAMGLANFDHIDEIICKRKALSERYDEHLQDCAVVLSTPDGCQRNYAYYPIVFKDAAERRAVQKKLNQENIFPRRYFYPSLNLLPYVKGTPCPVSEDITERILCLPLYPSLGLEVQDRIITLIRNAVSM